MHWAAKRGFMVIAEILIANKADIDGKDEVIYDNFSYVVVVEQLLILLFGFEITELLLDW